MPKDAKPLIASQPERKEGPQDYEIEEAMRTLLRAEEIKGNKELMPHVHKKMASHRKAIDSIEGLKARRNELAMKESEPDADD